MHHIINNSEVLAVSKYSDMIQCGHHHRQGIHLVKTVCLVMNLLTRGCHCANYCWKNFIYDYSLTPTVFDNASDVAHLVSTNFTW
jgi:hypothetical protein